MAGLRIAALATTRRRAGFRFGPEPVVLPASLGLAPEAVRAILADPMLSVEFSHDLESWQTADANTRSELVAALEELATQALEKAGVAPVVAAGIAEAAAVIAPAIVSKKSRGPRS